MKGPFLVHNRLKKTSLVICFAIFSLFSFTAFCRDLSLNFPNPHFSFHSSVSKEKIIQNIKSQQQIIENNEEEITGTFEGFDPCDVTTYPESGGSVVDFDLDFCQKLVDYQVWLPPNTSLSQLSQCWQRYFDILWLTPREKHCREYATLFLCSQFPRWSSGTKKYTLPCQSLCINFTESCSHYFEASQINWNVNCIFYPTVECSQGSQSNLEQQELFCPTPLLYTSFNATFPCEEACLLGKEIWPEGHWDFMTSAVSTVPWIVLPIHLFTIFSYILFKDLREYPNNIVLWITVSIAFLEVPLLFNAVYEKEIWCQNDYKNSNSSDWPCALQATSIHFGALLMMAWWLCFSLNTFVLCNYYERRTDWVKYYHTATWIPCLILSLIPLVSQTQTFDGFTPWCFVSDEDNNFWAYLTFYIPVLAGMSIGVSLLVFSLFHLTRVLRGLQQLKMHFRPFLLVFLVSFYLVVIFSYKITNIDLSHYFPPPSFWIECSNNPNYQRNECWFPSSPEWDLAILHCMCVLTAVIPISIVFSMSGKVAVVWKEGFRRIGIKLKETGVTWSWDWASTGNHTSTQSQQQQQQSPRNQHISQNQFQNRYRRQHQRQNVQERTINHSERTPDHIEPRSEDDPIETHLDDNGDIEEQIYENDILKQPLVRSNNNVRPVSSPEVHSHFPLEEPTSDLFPHRSYRQGDTNNVQGD